RKPNQARDPVSAGSDRAGDPPGYSEARLRYAISPKLRAAAGELDACKTILTDEPPNPGLGALRESSTVGTMSTALLPKWRDDWALFLDVDGTLLEIAATPAAVKVPARAIELIERLRRRLSGALALVSGRTVADLDRLFAPLRLPLAGAHGAERRSASGILQRVGDGDAL